MKIIVVRKSHGGNIVPVQVRLPVPII